MTTSRKLESVTQPLTSRRSRRARLPEPEQRLLDAVRDLSYEMSEQSSGNEALKRAAINLRMLIIRHEIQRLVEMTEW